MEKRICEDSRLIEIFGKANTHNTVLREIGEQIAWCSNKGCFQATREKGNKNCVEIGVTTGDWNDAVRDLKNQLDKLDMLRNHALNGGGKEVEEYIITKKVIKNLIEYYNMLLIQLDIPVFNN